MHQEYLVNVFERPSAPLCQESMINKVTPELENTEALQPEDDEVAVENTIKQPLAAIND